MKRGTSHPHGAAAVEFALVLPLLMLLVMGAIDWGYYFFVQEIVVNSAREGARAGSLCGPGTGCAGSADTTAETASTNYLANAGLAQTPGGCTASAPPSVCATLPSVTCGAGSCPSVSVTVTYPAGSITGFLDRFLGITMPNATATAVMRM